MAALSKQEFNEAVHAVITSVQHLYREVLRLNVAVTEALEEEPEPLRRLTMLNKAKEGSEAGRLTIRDSFAQLFGVGDTEDEDEDSDEGEESDEEQDEDSEGSAERRKSARFVELSPDDSVLSFKIVLRDLSRADGFEPQVQYAVLRDCGIASASKQQAGLPLRVKGHMLRRIPKVVQPGLPDGKQLITSARVAGKGGKGVDRRLSFRLAGPVMTRELYAIDGPAAVVELARDIKQHWRTYAAIVQ